MGTDEISIREVEGCSGTPGGGRYVMIRLAAQNHTIIEASYRCNGCAYAHQLTRALTTFLKGRTLDQAAKIDAQDLLAIAGPVPEGKDYYASMAIEALKDALDKTPPLQRHRTAGEVPTKEAEGVQQHATPNGLNADSLNA